MKYPINGLVLAGGKSSRMQADKSELVYLNKPQYLVVYELLQDLCDKVFISCQTEKIYPLPTITDKEEFLGIGPIAGLLSAFETKLTAWLVVAIDYPLLTHKDLEHLVYKRNIDRLATVFYNNNGFFEPFIGLYEASFYPLMKAEVDRGNFSLQQILKQTDAVKVTPYDFNCIKSIDTPEDSYFLKLKT